MAPEEGVPDGTGGGGDPTSPTTLESGAVTQQPYDWHTDIHPDVKNDEVWKSVPDVKTLTKAYADAARYNIGAIKIPSKDATPQDWDAYYRKLGRPESPEAYTVSDRLKESPTVQAMKSVAHTAGLTAAQWDTLQTGLDRIETEQARTTAAQRDATLEELSGEYGAALDGNLAMVQRLIRTHGGEETWEKLSKSALGNDAGYIRMMVSVAKAMAEEGLIVGHGPDGGTTKEDAQTEINTLTASEAYLKPRHPGHEAAVKRAKQLFEIVYN
jgi:hypothetical protein